MTEEKIRDESGKFIKGVAPYKHGSKGKKAREKEAADQAWFEVLAEAGGDPIKLFKLSLLRGSELKLSRNEAFKLADKLAPYVVSKAPTNVNVENDIKLNYCFNGIEMGDSLKVIEGDVVDEQRQDN